MTQTMLQLAPKDTGRLSDVFMSAYGSILGGTHNRLKFKRVNSAVVLLIDGLGLENLQEHRGHARKLFKLLETSGSSIRCGFPSSTAVSLTSLGTGLRSGEHGIAGYQVLDSRGEVRNMLNGWKTVDEARHWQAATTISELPEVSCHMVASGEYEGSGFTAAIMRGASFHGARAMAERAKIAAVLAKSSKTLVYLYFAELDQAAHRCGVGSPQWLAVLEEIDACLEPLVSRQFGLVITADHGVLNVPQENQIYLDEIEGFAEAVTTAVGDPRALYCYGDRVRATQSLLSLDDRVLITDFEELVAKGWMSAVPEILGQVPDFVLLSRGVTACYDRRTAKPASLQMVGQHGGITDTEMRVPLILAGAYSSS